jgi:hypothetical protein
MAQRSPKDELVAFLDRKAFDPVLRAKPSDIPEGKRSALEEVQRATKSERERYHRYGSADEVIRMFKDDLNSEPAKKVHRKLSELGLPTLNDLRAEFEALAERLDVG